MKLIWITLVALVVGMMALACTATPAATPTPSGPMYSEEAISILKANLQAKTPARIRSSGRVSCLMAIDGDSVT